MSQENVEVVRRAVAAVNRRDIDGYLACCSDDVQLFTPLADVTGVYEGPDGIRRFFADVGDTGPDFQLTIEPVEAIGPDRVLTFMLVTATGRASGIPQDPRTGNVYYFAGGKIERIQIFIDRAKALEAAGLSE